MDKKTFEYMESRTNAYKKLEREADMLKKIKEYLPQKTGLRIGNYHGDSCFEGESELFLKKAIDKAIDERIAEIEKKMEEI